jgi:phosphatidylserine decarboxylase
VTVGDTKQSTPSISKTLNPEWLVSFDFPITGTRCLFLEAVCWDKDRFGKDYLGEFDIAVEDIFANGQISQEVGCSLAFRHRSLTDTMQPRWFTLKSKRKDSKKKGGVSGDVQLQFSIVDTANPSATPQDILNKFNAVTAGSPEDEKDDDLDLVETQSRGDEDDDEDDEDETSDEADDPAKPETVEKRKRRLRLKKLKRKTKARAYEFTGGSDVTGILFLEIGKVTDLPPERNVTKTSFDMDPFVVASLGRKTFRTRVIRHSLNPVFDEKMVFQVLRHEQQFTINFAVVDRDKLSGNDFIGTTSFPVGQIISDAPEPNPDTGLYLLREPVVSEPPTPSVQKSRFRLPMSRSSSATSLNKLARPPLQSRVSQNSVTTSNGGSQLDVPTVAPSMTSAPSATSIPQQGSQASQNSNDSGDDQAQNPNFATEDDPDMRSYTIPLTLKHKEKWSDRHPTQILIRAKYLPYPALRQQFWRSMLKQYDADDSGHISKVELTTMLDTLGSTLKERTIDHFFERFASENGSQDPAAMELTYDQAVICLEEELQRHSASKKTTRETLNDMLPESLSTNKPGVKLGGPSSKDANTSNDTPANADPKSQAVPAIASNIHGPAGESGESIAQDDLVDDRGEEHVIEIRECPICHQPRLNKRSDADIITHIATCASQDWRQVNNIVMSGFVTSSQAQRKWYSKVITKISYGGYKLGANSANILVQDRLTGQINEERMSVYVRLGIRLLYKGLKSRDMERKRIRKLLRSLSFKQGRKFDDPDSARQINAFIQFHQLDMSEVLLPMDQFKNFNEFFYRALKPDARPCSAPENPRIIVSPSDCRSVVFNKLTEATKIWVKGREFSVERLLGNAYPEDAHRYTNGSLGIFRLAPQDYHRFHIPVDGIMGKPKLIDGEYYTVNPMAIRSALDVYGENIRVCVPIDSVAHGRVMVICVGAMMVGSTVITRQEGQHVKRAEELGYFKFGGSTILLLFEQGAMQFDDDLVDNSNGAVETLVSALVYTPASACMN